MLSSILPMPLFIAKKVYSAMSKFFLRLLGFILLLSTMGLATCQSVLKAAPVSAAAGFQSR
ncbi:hypothetical protein [Methylomonas rivi]|uniref:Uncharacterized protein n=1 Tax=Methylomonas rivi TaxID=2952226 RepID=A0ABT1U5H6_9GAMM|nr:hypothetical protein [Methylomonas sp. WSC-6]MBS4052623.1 hypothetical protein [Methylomonas sp.]MCQ8129055.1 hypothetical protein [Methylomonas sp. WSC-6]